MPATADATSTLVEPMKPWRVRAVYGVVGVIVLGHLHEIARQQEHWPFSNYEMWARVTRDWSLKEVVPVGFGDDPAPWETDLNDPSYFAPMPLHYQRLNFRRAASREKLRDAMLGDYLRRYEQRRAAGLHNGPPLKGIRLYEWRWTMDRQASNARNPDDVKLLYEFPAPPTTSTATRPAGGGA